MPVSTAETAMYKIVQITKDKIIPRGSDFWGSFTSSAAVETASKPMYAKKIIDAPANTPDQPKGMNGTQFEASTWLKPSARNNATTASLMATMTLLTKELCLTPRMLTKATTAKMRTAGRLTMPPSWGAMVSAVGKVIPKFMRMLLKYPDQPMATVDTAKAYSKIKSQPMTQAQNSPKATYP